MKVRQKCLASLAQLKRVFLSLPFKPRKDLYNALVLPHLDYCCIVWDECGSTLSKRIERIQNYAMRLLTSSPPRTLSAELRTQLSWTTLQLRRKLHLLTKVHRYFHNKAPPYLCSKFAKNLNANHRETPGSHNIYLHQPNTTFYRNSFQFSGAFHWNNLPTEIKKVHSEPAFKLQLQTKYLCTAI